MGYSRKLYSEWLPSDAIERPVWMVCASVQEIGKDHIHTFSVLDDPKRFKKCYHDDYALIKWLHDWMLKSDYLVAHSGDNFDWPMFTARLAYHGLPPVPQVKLVDTLKMARKHKFMANDLRFLARHFGAKEVKADAPDWDAVAVGDAEAIKYCIKYNRQDLRALEPVYERLLPYSKVKIHYGDEKCPYCGSEKYQSRGRDQAKGQAKNWRYVCLNLACRGWWTGKPPKSRNDLGEKKK